MYLGFEVRTLWLVIHTKTLESIKLPLLAFRTQLLIIFAIWLMFLSLFRLV